MKKAIACVAFFHIVCFASALLGDLFRNAYMIIFGLMADMAGAVICPIALAVTAGITGIRSETSALKLYPSAAAVIGGIGLARGAIFALAGGVTGIVVKDVAHGFAGAMRYLIISFILLTVWFIIFEITRFMMNSGTKYNKRKKS